MKMWYAGCYVLLCRERHHHGFSTLPQSITSWKQFENAFITQFNNDKTLGTLFLEISRLRINNKEKVRDFNQIFITLLDKPAEVVQIEFYTAATNCHVCK